MVRSTGLKKVNIAVFISGNWSKLKKSNQIFKIKKFKICY